MCVEIGYCGLQTFDPNERVVEISSQMLKTAFQGRGTFVDGFNAFDVREGSVV